MVVPNRLLAILGDQIEDGIAGLVDHFRPQKRIGPRTGQHREAAAKTSRILPVASEVQRAGEKKDQSHLDVIVWVAQVRRAHITAEKDPGVRWVETVVYRIYPPLILLERALRLLKHTVDYHADRSSDHRLV